MPGRISVSGLFPGKLKIHWQPSLAGLHSFKDFSFTSSGVGDFYGVWIFGVDFWAEGVAADAEGVNDFLGRLVDDLEDGVLEALHLYSGEIIGGGAPVIVHHVNGLGPTGKLVAVLGLSSVNQQAPALDCIGLFLRVETYDTVTAGFIMQSGQHSSPILKGGIADSCYADGNL